jgi:HKD family nuclease
VKATVVGHATDVPILHALRHTLADADEAILCSAFVRRAGVHLIEPQLTTLGERARLVATSTFGGPSTGEAFAALADLRTRLRVANPSRGTFHPKLYVARTSDTVRALVGSANLTGGLVSNVEAAILLEGSPHEPTLDDAWRAAQAYWSHEASELWTPVAAERSQVVLDSELLAAIRREVERDPVFPTVTSGKRNRVRDPRPPTVGGSGESQAGGACPSREAVARHYLRRSPPRTVDERRSGSAMIRRTHQPCLAVIACVPWR